VTVPTDVKLVMLVDFQYSILL